MHESDRNRLTKRLRALVLASQDMDQAALAARSVESEVDARLGRLLETAMAVCYMWPFTQSTLLTLTEYVPREGSDRELHEQLERLRSEVYTHTDKRAERKVTFSIGFESASETDWIPYAEQYVRFPRALLDSVISLCERLRDDMLVEARRTWIDLGRPQGDWF